MAEKILLLVLFYILLINATIYDAIKDSIDHKKGAETLYGFWHLVKHILRLKIFGAGIIFTLLIINIDSNLWRGFLVGVTISFLFVLKDVIWNPFYKSSLWKIIDNTWIIKTGWKWLDKKLGFDKQPPKG